MKYKQGFGALITLLLTLWVGISSEKEVGKKAQKSLSESSKPNFVIIFTDDQGYGDLGCFGSKNIKTPHIDQMAKEGLRLTSFMVASPVCTPSRGALLTGSYPKRIGMHKGVLFPDSKEGIHPDEYTIADHMKRQGYATGMFGKWHLGHHPETLPTRLGFDEFYGIPYSNDMNHEGKDSEGLKLLWSKPDLLWRDQGTAVSMWNTPLMEGEKITELPTDQRTITRRYTDKAIEFIRENKTRPFFVYLPHSMPHVPLYVPEELYDPDPKNAYKNVIEHIDAETGRLIKVLRELNLDKKTYVIFTSDNGPWTYFRNQGGSAGPLKGWKGRTFEGGMRVPCVVWGPGSIPAGSTSDGLATTLDLLPTMASLSGSPLPEKLRIDGLDLSEFLKKPRMGSPRKEFLYYAKNGTLEGIRDGDWKLLRKKKRRKKGDAKDEGPQYLNTLVDLSKDIGEKVDLAAQYPAVVEKMVKRMAELDEEITLNSRPNWKEKIK